MSRLNLAVPFTLLQKISIYNWDIQFLISKISKKTSFVFFFTTAFSYFAPCAIWHTRCVVSEDNSSE